MSDNNGVQTSVKAGEADLSLFDLGMSNDSIITGDDKGRKPNIFSSKGPDQQFLDNNAGQDDDQDDDDSAGADDPTKGQQHNQATDDDTDDDQDDDDTTTGGGSNTKAKPNTSANITDLDNDDDSDDSRTGRPKTDKSGLVDLAKKLIEAKQIVPFDDDKPLEKYSIQDFQELFQANFDDQRQQLQEEVSKEFWGSMPKEVQYIGQYLANGGNNLKQLFSALAQVEQTRDLDPEEDTDQELIAREYLRAKEFGTEDEITDEINSWKDLNKLPQKAKQFKPQLDKMKEDRVAQQLAAQENAKKKQQDAAKNYMKSVYEVLEPAELNGIKLDKKTQGMLYAGLVQANYPSVTGRQTNLLGHLMEKYQFVEPNHGLIAEVLWLLADPDGFKEQLRKGGASDSAKKTVKLLKNEESRRIANSASADDDDDTKKGDRKLSRPTNIFTGKKNS